MFRVGDDLIDGIGCGITLCAYDSKGVFEVDTFTFTFMLPFMPPFVAAVA